MPPVATAFWLVFLALIVAVVLFQLGRGLGKERAALCGLAGLFLLGGPWLLLDRSSRHDDRDLPDPVDVASVPAETCLKCHESHYQSWYRTYHRTMTREATPENVKGDFNNATLSYHGVTSRMSRDGDAFFMETADPVWLARNVKPDADLSAVARAPLRKFQVDRLVGSHWFQECLSRDEAGRYWRLPLSYHIVEKRWVHTNGAFLAPDTIDFWSKSTVWNESCLFCHNTRPSKWPVPGRRPDTPAGYRTEVAELGISCEACHGPGAEHVRVNQNPARRFALQHSGQGDPTIANPRRLSVERSDQVCGHCHGAIVPRPEAWNPVSMTDPYIAGQDLLRSYFWFWSEAQQELLSKGRLDEARQKPKPAPDDGRFWGDGTPLTTALEYNGMALSACYESGHGRLSCLSCHSAHPQEPNFLLKPRMDTNEGCYQCHESYRQRLTEHTHHAADSPGSLCYNCHMPYVVYSLLTPHRSHRIEMLRIQDSLGTGKPHACNLCHLDKSLDWTQESLAKWYGHAALPLPDEDQKYAASLVHLARDDARTRVIVAGAFSWKPAQQASGRDWPGPFLVRFAQHDRYPAVRYLLHRGLRSLYGEDAQPYNYLGLPAERVAQTQALRQHLDSACRPAPDRYPYLPLTPSGGVAEQTLEELLRRRHDPDIFIHE
jgi:predicted CXXCH cytochrome family protein